MKLTLKVLVDKSQQDRLSEARLQSHLHTTILKFDSSDFSVSRKKKMKMRERAAEVRLG